LQYIISLQYKMLKLVSLQYKMLKFGIPLIIYQRARINHKYWLNFLLSKVKCSFKAVVVILFCIGTPF